MTQTAEKIFSDAMKLDEAERIELAAKLMEPAELNSDSEHAEAWEVEINERERQLDAGEVQLIPWDDVRQMLRKGAGRDEAR